MSRDSIVISTRPGQSLIEIISNELPKLNKTQTKVAKVILADPKLATESSIAVLAKDLQLASQVLIDFVSILMQRDFLI